jgi:hypothetical protein
MEEQKKDLVGNGKAFEWVTKEDGSKQLVYHKENLGSIFKVNWTMMFLTIAIILILLSYKPMMESCQYVADNACDYCSKDMACSVCANGFGNLGNKVGTPVLGGGIFNGTS